MQHTIADHLKAQVADNSVISKELGQVADATVVLGGRIANSPMTDIEPAAGPVEACANDTLRIPAPKAGAEMAYLVNPGTRVQLQGVVLADAKQTEEGGNLIIETPNGGKIILLDYVNSAGVEDCEASLVGSQKVTKALAPQKLAALPEENLADIEPAAGPQQLSPAGDGGGFLVPTLLAGIGTGVGIFSRVGDPFATERGTDGPPKTDFFEPQGPSTPVPPAPKPVDAVNDSASVKNCNDCNTPINNKVTINVLANDTDADGSVRPLAAEITGFTNPAHGSVVKNADGTFTYTPADGFSGTDTFTYTVKNADGQTDTATVTINVLPCDPEPVRPVDAVNDSASVKNCHTCDPAQGNKVTINVLANDTDADGSVRPLAAEITGFTNPAHGSVVKNADGTFTYTPADGFSGTDTFTYTVKNADGQTDTATVTINVLPCDPEPKKPVDAVDDTAKVKENCGCSTVTQKSVTINVLANDTDQDGSVRPLASEITTFTQAGHGTVVKNADGTFTYTPAGDFVGVDTFTYTVKNADGQTDTATVTITVEPSTVDAVNDSANIARPTGGMVTQTINVLGNDSDAEGDSFSITSFTQPAIGSVVKNADGTFTYTSVGTNAAYDTTFTYTITDACGAVDTATVTIHVGGYVPPVRPVDAVDDTATVQEDCGCDPANPKSVTINVLGNDTDADGSVRPLAAEIIGFTQPANGTVVKNADGTFTYLPKAQFDGVDSFTYTVKNADGQTDTATVRVTVTPSTVDAVNDKADIARPTGGVVTQNINVLGNDVDAEGHKFSITSFTQPAIGSVVKNADGTFTYTSVGTNGAYETTFTYTITDACGVTDTATVTVCVGGYVPPVRPVDAVDDYATTRECNNHPGKPVTINVLVNDTDADGSVRPLAHEVVSATQPANGSVMYNGDGTFTYQPNAGFDGVDSFTYTVRNADGQMDTATVRITVTPNTVDAVDDIANVSRSLVDNPWAIWYGQPQYTAPGSVVINIRGNDYDPQGDSFTVVGVNQPNIGSVNYNADGTVTYTADPNILTAYTATFTYTIMDGCGAMDTATVTVYVPAVIIPEPPRPPEPPTTGGDSGGDSGGDGCPVAIDFDGNGLQVIARTDSNAQFDLHNDGTAEQTAWFGPRDGILVRDLNGNGQVDGINELFNNLADENGFAHLARTMDSNQDGVVDANDAGWNQLKIWFDADGNAHSGQGELVSMAEAGIRSISVTTHDTAVFYEGAYMPVASIVTMEDGSTRLVGDLFFTNTNDGEVHGAATNDLLVYGETAHLYDGGSAGTDILWVQEGGQDLTIGGDSGLTLNSVEGINLANGGADSLTLNLADVLAMNEDGLLTVRGDVADVLHLSGDVTRGADVVQNGETFANYTDASGAQLLVSAGVTVQLDEHRGCTSC